MPIDSVIVFSCASEQLILEIMKVWLFKMRSPVCIMLCNDCPISPGHTSGGTLTSPLLQCQKVLPLLLWNLQLPSPAPPPSPTEVSSCCMSAPQIFEANHWLPCRPHFSQWYCLGFLNCPQSPGRPFVGWLLTHPVLLCLGWSGVSPTRGPFFRSLYTPPSSLFF